jgi:hypothetical protein
LQATVDGYCNIWVYSGIKPEKGGTMNKHIVAEMITEKLKKEVGIEDKPFPEELRILEAEIPSEALPPGGKMCMEAELYQADKIKKISIVKNAFGEISGGNIVLITPADDYDLPFIVVDVTFMSGEPGMIFTELDAKPLVQDEESMRKYIDPFREWREAIDKIPSEPITGRPEPGEFIKSILSPINYLRFVPIQHTNEVLNFTDQFLEIYLSIYRKAEPVKDLQRREKMDTFRSEFNRHFLGDDPAGVMLIHAFGEEKALLFCKHIVNL